MGAGLDAADLRSLPRPERSWMAALGDPSVPVRVSWSPTLGYAESDQVVLEACERAASLLAEVGPSAGKRFQFDRAPSSTAGNSHANFTAVAAAAAPLPYSVRDSQHRDVDVEIPNWLQSHGSALVGLRSGLGCPRQTPM